MKKVILSFSLLLLASIFINLTAQEGPEIEFNIEVYNYEEIEQGSAGTYEFIITNTGTEPLILSGAKASSNSLVPTWSKEPIAPGKTAILLVTYDTSRVGLINKSITISSNAVNSPTKIIRVKGKVIEKT